MEVEWGENKEQEGLVKERFVVLELMSILTLREKQSFMFVELWSSYPRDMNDYQWRYVQVLVLQVAILCALLYLPAKSQCRAQMAQ